MCATRLTFLFLFADIVCCPDQWQVGYQTVSFQSQTLSFDVRHDLRWGTQANQDGERGQSLDEQPGRVHGRDIQLVDLMITNTKERQCLIVQFDFARQCLKSWITAVLEQFCPADDKVSVQLDDLLDGQRLLLSLIKSTSRLDDRQGIIIGCIHGHGPERLVTFVQQLGHSFASRLAAHLEFLDLFGLNLDWLTKADHGSGSETVRMEIVQTDGNDFQVLEVRVLGHGAQRHDGEAGFEREHLGTVVAAALGENGDALVVGEVGVDLMIDGGLIDMRYDFEWVAGSSRCGEVGDRMGQLKTGIGKHSAHMALVGSKLDKVAWRDLLCKTRIALAVDRGLSVVRYGACSLIGDILWTHHGDFMFDVLLILGYLESGGRTLLAWSILPTWPMMGR